MKKSNQTIKNKINKKKKRKSNNQKFSRGHFKTR